MQVLVFKRIEYEYINNIFIYPIFIMLLPIEMPAALVIIISFVLGITLDSFYDSMGIHAGTCVFIAFLRYYILGFLEPKGGYPNNTGPTQSKLGFGWFARYSSLFLLIHMFIYFSIEQFSFVYILTILSSTILSFFFSMIFITIYQFLLNPKE
jgi:hypothetical protein